MRYGKMSDKYFSRNALKNQTC